MLVLARHSTRTAAASSVRQGRQGRLLWVGWGATLSKNGVRAAKRHEGHFLQQVKLM